MDSLMFSMLIAAVICAFAAIVASIWLPHRERWATATGCDEDQTAPDDAGRPAAGHAERRVTTRGAARTVESEPHVAAVAMPEEG